jgi:ferredoxin-NADP reductase
VKAHPGGLVSSYLHRNAAPGLVLGLSHAEGSFQLPTPRPERILLISGGSGITPVLSMLRTLCSENHQGAVTFLHYARTEADVPHLRELRELAAAHDNVRLVLAYTEAEAEAETEARDGELAGLFSREHLRAAAPDHARAQTYLCGPGGLMRSVRELFDELGLAQALHTEEFAPAVPTPDLDAVGQVSFAGSGIRADNSGRTLLEQAEDAGLDPQHGCRMGICFSCTQIKNSGCVRNIRTGATSTEEDEEIQLCICVPVGDVTLDL